MSAIVAPNVEGAMANDRYTTRSTLQWCMKVLGVDAFDLDVAACEESHKASLWFSAPPGGKVERTWPDGSRSIGDGLLQPWNRERIWCNPPYDDIESWVRKAWDTMFGRCWTKVSTAKPVTKIAMLIPDNRREQPFWQNWIEPFRDGRWDRLERDERPAWHSIHVAYDAGARLFTHSLPGRQAFGVPGNPEGIGQQSPPFGVVLLEWRFQ